LLRRGSKQWLLVSTGIFVDKRMVRLSSRIIAEMMRWLSTAIGAEKRIVELANICQLFLGGGGGG
jgi:hypothetical protein